MTQEFKIEELNLFKVVVLNEQKINGILSNNDLNVKEIQHLLLVEIPQFSDMHKSERGYFSIASFKSRLGDSDEIGSLQNRVAWYKGSNS